MIRCPNLHTVSFVFGENTPQRYDKPLAESTKARAEKLIKSFHLYGLLECKKLQYIHLSGDVNVSPRGRFVDDASGVWTTPLHIMGGWLFEEFGKAGRNICVELTENSSSGRRRLQLLEGGVSPSG